MPSPIFTARFTHFSLIVLTILILIAAPGFARWDDPAYHHLDEILPELLELQAEYPDWMRIDTIGYTQQDGLPIHSIFISNDVNDTTFTERSRWLRPAVIYVGQVHGEEILGVEFIMWLANEMMTNRGRDWRDRIDTYLVPTANPEGLSVVYSLDNTWRKNKRDNIGDGFLRQLDGWGGDTSGVDINRNFPTFWSKGKKFLQLPDKEFYDYYRGPAPASESETQALIALFDQVRPLYAMTLHSSRTGNVAEKVIYPWGWGTSENKKRPPDVDFLDEYGNQLSIRCKTVEGNSTFQPNPISNPRGDSEMYYYYTFGTFSSRIEIGQKQEAMQPDSAGIYKIITEDCVNGLLWMLNSAAGLGRDDYGELMSSRLDIRVIDAVTDLPLYAKLKMDSLSIPIIPHRYTNPNPGRRQGCFYWGVMPGHTDTLRVSSFGYEPRKFRISAGSSPAFLFYRNGGIQLTPLEWRDIQVSIFDDAGVAITSPTELKVIHSDTTWTSTILDGSTQLNIPDGDYSMMFTKGTEYVPRTIDITVNDSDTTWALNVGLSPASVLLSENFDGPDVIHTSDNVMNKHRVDSLGRWEMTRDLSYSPPRCLTDTRYGDSPKFEDGWDAPYDIYSKSFNLSDAATAAVTFMLNQDLEPGHDSLWVEFSTGDSDPNPSSWTWVQGAPAKHEFAILNWKEMDNYANRPWNSNKINLMQFHDWEKVIVMVPDEFLGESVVHFRFRLKTDFYVELDGVYIDDVYLLSSGFAPPEVASEPIVPMEFSLGSPYPNPFNSMLSVPVNLPENSSVTLSLYDITGRRSYSSTTSEFVAGSHRLTLDAATLPSGVYFLQANAAGKSAVKKVMLLR
ncbi:MAG: T9SS type A sorting domain-containing protein [Calditrichaeota bacterium]|nr:T9SS type A sorting domain-containing protein [Calditrichota bacterium]